MMRAFQVAGLVLALSLSILLAPFAAIPAAVVGGFTAFLVTRHIRQRESRATDADIIDAIRRVTRRTERDAAATHRRLMSVVRRSHGRREELVAALVRAVRTLDESEV